jgi:hypothetical protein
MADAALGQNETSAMIRFDFIADSPDQQGRETQSLKSQ